MPLTGEAKREYQRLYMRDVRRKARAAGRLVSAAVQQAKQRSEGRPARPEDTARTALAIVLENQGLTVERVVRKVAEKLAAKKHQTVAGKARLAEDNDTQLRAAETAIRLHERAGTIPSERSHIGGPGTLIVNILTAEGARAMRMTSGALEAGTADGPPETRADSEGDPGAA